jgi:hypothetical protein
VGKVHFWWFGRMKYLAYSDLGLWKMNDTFVGTACNVKGVLIKIIGIRMPGGITKEIPY